MCHKEVEGDGVHVRDGFKLGETEADVREMVKGRARRCVEGHSKLEQ